MTTFTWRDTLTVSVGEMSRAQALDCSRQFDAMIGVFDYADLLEETDVIGVLHAPVTIKVDGEMFGGGERFVKVGEDEPFKLTLPLTRECFSQLPMSLTQQWVSAMILSNEWLIDALKKASSLTPANASAPKSGSAPSSEPIPEPTAMTTTGQNAIPQN